MSPLAFRSTRRATSISVYCFGVARSSLKRSRSGDERPSGLRQAAPAPMKAPQGIPARARIGSESSDCPCGPRTAVSSPARTCGSFRPRPYRRRLEAHAAVKEADRREARDATRSVLDGGVSEGQRRHGRSDGNAQLRPVGASCAGSRGVRANRPHSPGSDACGAQCL